MNKRKIRTRVDDYCNQAIEAADDGDTAKAEQFKQQAEAELVRLQAADVDGSGYTQPSDETIAAAARAAAGRPDAPEALHHLRDQPVVSARRGRQGEVVFNSGDRFTDFYGSVKTRAAFGEWALAATNGADDYTPPAVREFFNAQTTSPDSAGGALVPEQLSSMLVDLARAKMVMNQAGVTTVAMNSESYLLPTVVTDPTFAATAENTAIGKSDAVFGQVVLTPKKYAGICEASNELVQSGVDFASRLTDIMSSALAVTVDSALLNGDGIAPNVLGIFANTDIATTTLTAAITRTAIDAAVQAIRERNHEPNAVILSPANYHALSLEQASTSGVWQGPPQSSADLRYLPSSSVADTELVVGDFTRYVLGQREGLRLEISRTGDGVAWSNDLTSFRAITRIDAAPGDPSAFQIIDGIT